MAYRFTRRRPDGETESDNVTAPSFEKAGAAIEAIDQLRRDGWIIENVTNGTKPIDEAELRRRACLLSEQ